MSPRATILISGAGGFIGRAITTRLAADGAEVVVALRRRQEIPGAAVQIAAGDLTSPNASLDLALRRCEAVVHAAGLAHRFGADPALLHAANVTAAERVAEAAAKMRVKHFVLISSAAVHGKARDDIITEVTPAHPDDAYALSKYQGEQAVAAVLKGTATRLTILRPCAVIGPGCAGNIPRLATLIARGLPLPFAGIRNLRSFIVLDDLAALVAAVLKVPDPLSLLLAASPRPISTPALIRALAQGLGQRVVLVPAPVGLLRLAASAAGRRALWQSFAGNFHVDPDRARANLGFIAPTPIETALHATGKSLR